MIMSSSKNSHQQLWLTLSAFCAGASVALVLQKLRNRSNITHSGATAPGNDGSLFYGNKTQLITITPKRKFLPKEVYGELVRETVVCCLDIVLTRRNNQCLLVHRSSEPVKGYWWWPGGRILKGETFFDAAIRKAKEETGVDADGLKPIQVLGVWNTFFPTSHWDNEESQGTQTVNVIVLVEMKDDTDVKIKLDDTSGGYKWISMDPELAKNEDIYVQEALQRVKTWKEMHPSSLP